MNLKSRFAERPVFVTGADGFVGSHLTEQLVEFGADVHVFVRATSSGELQNIRHLRDEITIHRGDLRDKHSVEQAMKHLTEYSDTIVFHLAAQAHVGESWDRPYETIDTNVVGTLNLLQTVVDLDLDIAKFDTAGTSEEYGNVDGQMEDKHEYDSDGRVLLSERSPVNPTSVYATSKLAADFLTMNYHDAYGLPGVTTRMFNNYGPRQNPRYITGTIVTQALERGIVELGNLTPRRDMCYVSDGVRGHMHVALEGSPGEEYVYGYGENISMRDWTELLLEVGSEEGYWEDPEIVQRDDRYRPGDSDVEELLVGYEKLHEETGWEPEVSWREGARHTIEWYAANKEKWFGRVDWR
ncbi:DTDP-glucose-46-dehydratase [Haloarcula marismortui ATCC 43049]|uniref:SDR family oxidoreductase n=1 Tax=Haloarcula marismortui (strain ATCC 43049 / DSM 3752 / JCM 8966 / VKM B-1809) TaxID=272569 RepID=Q5V1W2_HALMA|nr:GDP-mannose 4,6-dehydratase [Haloarcula marismortui]AAV46490.1 DTDP-glucose-46-dehydratase [Haloarcula marismortui ATCC 43049]QCP91210.1 SDR family oxidoreductase [Haloarcula marismortui ATCC 43049]